MTPFLDLQQLLKEIEAKPEQTLTSEQLEDYFEKLILVANIPEAYQTLCWEVGVWLLLLSNQSQDTYFNRYGYTLIGAALAATIADGALPDGLGWYTAGFVPNDVDGDLMLNVLSHPIVQTRLNQSLREHEFKLTLKRLDPDDQILGQVTVRFLTNIHRFGLDSSRQLMWAARLARHFSLENPARKLALRLILSGLVDTKRYINAFYWLQAHFVGSLHDDLSDTIFEVIVNVVELALRMAEQGDQILARMSYNDTLWRLIASSQRTKLFLGLMTLWLLVVKGILVKSDPIEHCIDILWKEYPNLSIFINIFSTWALQISDQPAQPTKTNMALEYLHAPHHKAVAFWEINKQLANLPSDYRGQQLALDIWQTGRDTVFSPLLVRLQTANNKQLEALKTEISLLRPETLLESEELLKVGQHTLDHQIKQMILADFQEYIDQLTTIADLCYKTNIVSMFIEQIEGRVVWDELYQECDAFITAWPTLSEYIRTYFLPIVDICAGAG